MKFLNYVLLVIFVMTCLSACGHKKPRPAFLSGTLYDIDGTTPLPGEKLLFYVHVKTLVTDLLFDDPVYIYTPQFVSQVTTDNLGKFSAITQAGHNSIFLLRNTNDFYLLDSFDLAAKEQKELILIRTDELYYFSERY